jgi:hypothetical protein
MQEPNPTEPANYRGAYSRGSKEIVDIEIAMYQSDETVFAQQRMPITACVLHINIKQ